MRPSIGCALWLVLTGCEASLRVDIDGLDGDTAAPDDTDDVDDTDDTDEPAPAECVGEGTIRGQDFRQVVSYDAQGRPVRLERVEGDTLQVETWTYEGDVVTHIVQDHPTAAPLVEVITHADDGTRTVESHFTTGWYRLVYDADGHPLLQEYGFESFELSEPHAQLFEWSGDTLVTWATFLYPDFDAPYEAQEPYRFRHTDLDPQGRVTSEQTAFGGEVRRFDYTYGPDGDLEWYDERYCIGGWPIGEYDRCGLFASTDYVYEDGRLDRVVLYDGNGVLLGTNDVDSDASGRVIHFQGTTWTYDAAGRLIERSTPEDTSRWAYDDAGRIVLVEFVSAAESRRETWTWDDEGNLLGYEISGDGQPLGTWTFDAVGNLLTFGDDTAVTWSGDCACQRPIGDTVVEATARHEIIEPWSACGELWEHVPLAGLLAGGSPPPFFPDGPLLLRD